MLGAQREVPSLQTAASLVLSDGSDVFQSQVALNYRERTCEKRSASSSKGRSIRSECFLTNDNNVVTTCSENQSKLEKQSFLM